MKQQQQASQQRKDLQYSQPRNSLPYAPPGCPQANLLTSQSKTHLGYEYTTGTISPESLSIVPILRSGLGMLEGDSNFNPPSSTFSPAKYGAYMSLTSALAIQTLLPNPAPVHHLGLFREPTTLEPVEYYNNLPYHKPAANTPSDSPNSGASQLALLLDPVIATGGTCAAAIQTLREWGVKRVIVVAVLGALPGVLRAASEWPEGVEIWIAGLDEDVNDKGMIKPGLGDVGDRLFLTIGK